MASSIKIKRSDTSGNPSTLGAGELAYSALTENINTPNGGDRLYIGTGTETAGNAVNHVVIGGKYFTDMLDHAPGTLTASSAIVVDANSKVDVVKTTNLQIGGSGATNVIASTNSNGNIELTPNGTGLVRIANAFTLPNVAGTNNYVLTSNGAGSSTWQTTGSAGLGTITSADLSTALTDETGTGFAVFNTSPTLITPALGTPSALIGTNITGIASGFTAGTVTTNANLTGHITSTGNATILGSFSSANLLAALTDKTGTGANVFATSPTLVTPVLGTPSSGTLSSCTVDGTDLVGFKNIPVNSQSAAYTTVLADSGKVLLHPSADTTARTYTIAANASVAYPLGTTITFVNMSTATVTIAIATDTLYLSPSGATGSFSLSQYGSATAIKITTTNWIIGGSGLL